VLIGLALVSGGLSVTAGPALGTDPAAEDPGVAIESHEEVDASSVGSDGLAENPEGTDELSSVLALIHEQYPGEYAGAEIIPNYTRDFAVNFKGEIPAGITRELLKIDPSLHFRRHRGMSLDEAGDAAASVANAIASEAGTSIVVEPDMKTGTITATLNADPDQIAGDLTGIAQMAAESVDGIESVPVSVHAGQIPDVTPLDQTLPAGGVAGGQRIYTENPDHTLTGCSVGFVAVDKGNRSTNRPRLGIVTAGHCPRKNWFLEQPGGERINLTRSTDRSWESHQHPIGTTASEVLQDEQPAANRGWDAVFLKINARSHGRAYPYFRYGGKPYSSLAPNDGQRMERPPNSGSGSGKWAQYVGRGLFPNQLLSAPNPGSTPSTIPADIDPLLVEQTSGEPILGMKVCNYGASSWENEIELPTSIDGVTETRKWYGRGDTRANGRHCAIIIGVQQARMIGNRVDGDDDGVYESVVYAYWKNVLVAARADQNASLNGDSGSPVWLDTADYDSGILLGILNGVACDGKYTGDEEGDRDCGLLRKEFWNRLVRAGLVGQINSNVLSDPANGKSWSLMYFTPLNVVERQLRVKAIRMVQSF
jgi:hypothetical protein